MAGERKQDEKKPLTTRESAGPNVTREAVQQAIADLLRWGMIEIVPGSIPVRYRVVNPH